MARVAVRIVDQFDNILPYQTSGVTWSLEGDAQFIGENPMVLLGGQDACFVRAGHQAGKISIRASVPMLQSAAIELDIID